MAEYSEIDVQTLAGILDDVFLLDVREPDEYVDAHVPGAIPMPLATVPDSLGLLPEGEVVHVICAAGGRSGRAVEFLVAQGIEAVNIAGGTNAWIQTGNPVVTGDEPF